MTALTIRWDIETNELMEKILILGAATDPCDHNVAMLSLKDYY